MRARLINEARGYWNGDSLLFPEYQEFWDELVPPSDAADTLQGELLRMISRIHYDYYNNGFGNSRKDESYFLFKHQNLFKPFMKDPSNFDKFFSRYKSSDFGDNIYSSSRGEIWPGVETQIDDIIDAIVKYIRLTKHKLIPNKNDKEE